VIVVLRALPLEFGLTEKVTDPLPCPPLSEVIVTQLALLVAFQMQSSPAITWMVPLPPNPTNA
jgi:hypothetical protein